MRSWGKHHKGAAKKQADTGIGLGGTALDYSKIQEVLYARPTGKDDRGSYVHQLMDFLMVGDLSVFTANMILNQIKSWGTVARVGSDGIKHICLYFTGHGEANTGNWCFKDGTINLAQILE